MPYPVLDLSTPEADVKVTGETDPKVLADQLTEVRDALISVVAGPQATIQTLVLSLTVDPDGGLAFVTRGAPNASLVMTFTKSIM
jgi:hypothetical protein